MAENGPKAELAVRDLHGWYSESHILHGMNFEVMPELAWVFGYPMALVLMVGSAVASYWVFKIRGWL